MPRGDRGSSTLWAITSYFNPAGYARRLANYREFRRRLRCRWSPSSWGATARRSAAGRCRPARPAHRRGSVVAEGAPAERGAAGLPPTAARSRGSTATSCSTPTTGRSASACAVALHAGAAIRRCRECRPTPARGAAGGRHGRRRCVRSSSGRRRAGRRAVSPRRRTPSARGHAWIRLGGAPWSLERRTHDGCILGGGDKATRSPRSGASTCSIGWR